MATRPSVVAVLSVGLPALLAAVVGAWSITVPSLWRDESVSVHFARASLGDAWRMWGSLDAVHATYDLMLRPVVRIEPLELGVRLPSLIGFVVATVGVALLGRRLSGWSLGVTAGCVYAILPFAGRYAQEARSYALVSAVAVFATLALLRACERPTAARLAAYVGLVALLGHLHLYALLLLLAHALHVLLVERAAVRRVVAAWVAAGLAILPLAVVAAGQRDRQLSWLRSPEVGQLAELTHAVAGTWSATVVLGTAVLAGCWVLRRHPIVVAWAVVPVVVSFAISQTYPVFTPRYVLFVVPAVALLAGAGIEGTARRLGPARLAVPGVVATVLLLAILTWPAQRDIRAADSRPDDLRSMSRDIAGALRPGDGIAPVPASYLPFVDAYATPFDRSPVVDAAAVPPDMSRVWVISRGFPSVAPRSPGIGELSQDFRRTRVQPYGYTYVSLWERRSPR